jgi:hypothetical protein
MWCTRFRSRLAERVQLDVARGLRQGGYMNISRADIASIIRGLVAIEVLLLPCFSWAASPATPVAIVGVPPAPVVTTAPMVSDKPSQAEILHAIETISERTISVAEKNVAREQPGKSKMH